MPAARKDAASAGPATSRRPASTRIAPGPSSRSIFGSSRKRARRRALSGLRIVVVLLVLLVLVAFGAPVLLLVFAVVGALLG